MLCGEPSTGSGPTDMYSVGIVAALEREVRPFLKLRRWRTVERDHDGRRFRFFEDGEDAVLICGGIGQAAARRAAEALLALYSPTLVYSVGFAGALEPGSKVGDLFLPSQVINAADGSRVTLAQGEGTLVSFASVASPEQKAKLRESYAARLVDMEAAAVFRAAELHGAEFLAVKAISDEYDFHFPDLDRFVDANGNFRQGRFALYAAVRPWLWWKVIQLAHNSHHATNSLCDWLTASLNRMIACAPEHTKGEAQGR